MRQFLALVSVALLAACSQPLPTQPTNVNVYNQNTQNQGENQNQSGGGQVPGQGCTGLVNSLAASVTGGTFSGGKGHPNEPILFSVSTSPALPPQCLSAPLSVTAAGVCVVPAGFAQTLDHAAVLPNSAGLCVVAVSYDGKSTSFTVDVI